MNFLAKKHYPKMKSEMMIISFRDRDLLYKTARIRTANHIPFNDEYLINYKLFN